MRKVRRYGAFLRRWWWLLLFGLVVPMGVAYSFVQRQPTLYQARVVLMVGTTIQSLDPDPREMATSVTLAEAYGELVRYRQVTEAVIRRLGLQRSPEDLAAQISTVVKQHAQLLEVYVTDVDPVMAASIANALAEELIAQTPASSAAESEDQVFVKQRLDDLREKIRGVQERMQEIGDAMATMTSAAELQYAQDTLEGLQQLESMWLASYAQLLSSYIGSSPNTLRVFEPAVPPDEPVPNRAMLFVGLAGVAGVALAVGGALAVEYVDDTLRWGELEEPTLLGVPVLGAVVCARGGSRLAVDAPVGSVASRSIRRLRTALLLAMEQHPSRVLLVTSAVDRERKGLVAANVAAALAASGRRVVLVDAHLGDPDLQGLFEVPEEAVGLSELVLRGDVSLLDEVVRETPVDRLWFVPAGHGPADPALVLTAPTFPILLQGVSAGMDVVVMVGPPALGVPEAAFLASLADGVLLVVRSGYTLRRMVAQTLEVLRLARGKVVLGVVFGLVRGRRWPWDRWRRVERDRGWEERLAWLQERQGYGVEAVGDEHILAYPDRRGREENGVEQELKERIRVALETLQALEGADREELQEWAAMVRRLEQRQ